MIGVIFFSLQKFLRAQLSTADWSRLFDEAQLAPKMYLPSVEYADEEAIALVQAASRLLERPPGDILEAFGEAVVPDLVNLYRPLISPEWTALDLIANAEGVIHTAIRQANPSARPPVLQCLRLSDSELQLVYASPRKLCPLAKGILAGVGVQFGEPLEVAEHSCMYRGDAFCTLHVKSLVAAATRPVDEADLANPVTRVETISWPGPSGATLLPRNTRSGKNSPDPSQVAQYRILERLGVGGMGIVFRAEDNALGRQVALKLMKPGTAVDKESRERFVREARAMAALASERVVTIYQVGLHGDQPFIAMQLLRGMTLEARLAEQPPMSHAEVIRIGCEIAEGLAAAHDQGLVHRDVKPTNIWLEAPRNRVKLLDFGIARNSTALDQFTQTGTLLGTPHYISPEQAAGEAVDGRSDLFSLGVILYRMCAGRLPFQGNSLIAVLRSLAVEVPRPLQELVPDIPQSLAELVARLLSRSADDRPPTARLVVEELEKQVAGLSRR